MSLGNERIDQGGESTLPSSAEERGIYFQKGEKRGDTCRVGIKRGQRKRWEEEPTKVPLLAWRSSPVLWIEKERISSLSERERKKGKLIAPEKWWGDGISCFITRRKNFLFLQGQRKEEVSPPGGAKGKSEKKIRKKNKATHPLFVFFLKKGLPWRWFGEKKKRGATPYLTSDLIDKDRFPGENKWRFSVETIGGFVRTSPWGKEKIHA